MREIAWYQELTILQWTQFLSLYSKREARRDQVLQESSALIHNVFGTFHCLINFSYQFGGFRAKFLGTGDGDGASPQQENPRTSQVVVRQTSTVAIGVQPMIKVDLIQVRGDDFFSQLVSFGANEGTFHPARAATRACVMRLGSHSENG